MSDRNPTWYAEITFYDDGTYRQTNGHSFEKWLAEHDAALIEGLADEWSADPDAWGDNEKDYRNTLREKARQRREETA